MKDSLYPGRLVDFLGSRSHHEVRIILNVSHHLGEGFGQTFSLGVSEKGAVSFLSFKFFDYLLRSLPKNIVVAQSCGECV